MKPTHKVFCRDCNRSKMLFETEKKALRFIEFNADTIVEEGGKRPKRAYYCPYCLGYHITSSIQYREGVTSTNNIIKAYNDSKKKEDPKLEELIKDVIIKVPKQNSSNELSQELKDNRQKMRALLQDIKALLEFYEDKTSSYFIDALKLEQEVFNSINCDDIKAKTQVETILKQYLNND